jgi:hypothetical protein
VSLSASDVVGVAGEVGSEAAMDARAAARRAASCILNGWGKAWYLGYACRIPETRVVKSYENVTGNECGGSRKRWQDRRGAHPKARRRCIYSRLREVHDCFGVDREFIHVPHQATRTR